LCCLQERAATLHAHSTAAACNGNGTHMSNGHMANGNCNGLSSSTLAPAVLFFGCRARTQDYIYEEELAAHLKGGELAELHVAFSREGASKDYVQHHMERQAETVWKLLGEQGGSLYVCGDAKHMAKDVQRALVALVAANKGCSTAQAEAWVKELQDTGRYQRDVW
jgi:NADPH-ferrihemoprotein reductase